MLTDPRHLHWDACLNVRDLGGFPTRGGGTTRRHALVRADNLCRLTAHGRSAMLRHGVRTAIDLREPGEYRIEYEPFDRPELDTIDRVEIPLLTRAFRRGWPSGLDGHEVDLLCLETCGDAIATVFAAFAVAPPGGVVLYCHAGKERTGFASALILELAGVDRATIAREHALSDEHLAPLYAAWLDAEPDPEERQRLRNGLKVKADQMKLTLAALDELYGGIEQYLLDCGLERSDIDAVRARLVE